MSRSLMFLKGQITRGEKRANNVSNYNLYSIRHFLEELESDYREFKQKFSSLEMTDALVAEFEVYEERYQKASSIFREEIDRKLNRTVNDSIDQTRLSDKSVATLVERQHELFEAIGKLTSAMHYPTESRLPTLKVPVFSGNYRDWARFRNLFLSNVGDNPRLSEKEKLGHLLSLLSGEAASSLQHLPLTEVNYGAAWEILLARYDKPYLIARDLISNLTNAPVISRKSDVRSLYNQYKETMAALDNMSDYCKTRDPWVINLITGKFDKDIKNKWAHEIAGDDSPTLEKLNEFWLEECEAIELQEDDRECDKQYKAKPNLRKDVRMFKSLAAVVGNCFVCEGDHKIFYCDRFAKLSITEREKLVKSKSRCLNCLGAGHFASACKSKNLCNRCGRKHHSLLHGNSTFDRDLSGVKTNNSLGGRDTKRSSESKEDQRESLIKVNLSTNDDPKAAILPTAYVDVQSANNSLVTCRVMLDSGAQASFIRERCLRRLGISRSQVRVPLLFMSSSTANYSKGAATIKIISKYDKSKTFTAFVHVLTQLTCDLPERELNLKSSSYLKRRFQLADPEFDIPAEVDIVLGSDHFFGLLGGGKYYQETDRIWIVESSLGWLVSGGVIPASSDVINVGHATLKVEDKPLDQVLERFWSLEEPKLNGIVDKEEEICERVFQETTSRNEEGRYSVSLPLKDPRPNLGESFHLALRRFLNLEKRLNKDQELKNAYLEVVDQFERDGYIERISDTEMEKPVECRFYLPHYGVINRNGKINKLRIVFDASMMSDNGISLNDILMVGPNLQRDIVTLLIRFSFHRYVFTADIKKMYRQIQINSGCRDFQRLLWRKFDTDEIGHYRLTTLTDGESSSPYLALRVMKQLAIDEAERFPLASKIMENRYMDDFFVGEDDLENLVRTRDQLIGILAAGGMSLGKWAANDFRVLVGISGSDRSNVNNVESAAAAAAACNVLNHMSDL